MKRVYCTFGGSAYDRTIQRTVEDGPRFGVDEVRVYDDLWVIGTEFFERNRRMWEIPDGLGKERRGFGWYCWKPYVILLEVLRAQPGDIVLFSDADTYPIADLSPLFEECHRIGGQMFFRAEGWNQRQWCKRDAMIVMDQDEERYLDVPHGTARFMLFEADDNPRLFLEEWLAFMTDPRTATVEPSVLGPEHPGFEEHRSDQAIMTNLVHKYGHHLYREADEFGNGVERNKELYGQLFKQVYRSPLNTLEGSKYRNV